MNPINTYHSGEKLSCGENLQVNCEQENKKVDTNIPSKTNTVVYYDVASELGCAGGVSYQRVAVYTETGVFSRFDYIDSSGAVSATMPAGFTLGPCVETVPQIENDVEYVCNETTNMWDKILHTWIDGVPQADVITPTTISCSDTPPVSTDFEYVCDTTTGFYQIVERSYDVDGVFIPGSEIVTTTTAICSVAPVAFDVTIQTGCLDTDTAVASTQATQTVQALIPAENIVNVRVIDCGQPRIDPEIVCLVPNGSPVDTQPISGVVVYDVSVNPPTATYYIGNTDVTATHTQVSCDTNQDHETKETCYQDITNPNQKYTRIDWFEKDNLLVPVSTVWFDIITGSYSVTSPSNIEPCKDVSKTVDVPNCDGSTTPLSVDNVSAVYLLNQQHKHTEVIYDVLTAVFGGTATFNYTAPFNVAVSYVGVTLANDTMLQYWTDFGDSYSDVGANPDHSYLNDGAYEIKGYAITTSGNKVLLFAKEVTISGGVITYSGVQGSQAVNRTYTRLVASAFQDYCDGILVGTAYNPDKTPYVLVGDFVASAPIVIDELEDNADYNGIKAVTETPIFYDVEFQATKCKDSSIRKYDINQSGPGGRTLIISYNGVDYGTGADTTCFGGVVQDGNGINPFSNANIQPWLDCLHTTVPGFPVVTIDVISDASGINGDGDLHYVIYSELSDVTNDFVTPLSNAENYTSSITNTCDCQEGGLSMKFIRRFSYLPSDPTTITVVGDFDIETGASVVVPAWDIKPLEVVTEKVKLCLEPREVDNCGTKKIVEAMNVVIVADESCGAIANAITLRTGGVSIANGTFSTNLGPDGTIWNNPGGLRSITIRARRSNNGNAIVGSGANQVVVTSTDNAYVLLAGESVTYSVEDGNIQDLISVETLNNAAALIIYNRI